MRREGKLVSKCKKIIRFDDKEMNYEGEIDEHNMACGRGTATRATTTIVGTFEADQLMEFCLINYQKHFTMAGEFKDGAPFGKMTVYNNRFVNNYIVHNGAWKYDRDITNDLDQAFYTRDGKTLKALDNFLGRSR